MPARRKRWCRTSLLPDPLRSPATLSRDSSVRGRRVLQTPHAVAFISAQNNHLGLGVSGSGVSHGNRWIPCEANAPINIGLHKMRPQQKIVLVAPPTQSSHACMIYMQGNKSGFPFNHQLVGLKQSQNFPTLTSVQLM
jgi:hypothetical protein